MIDELTESQWLAAFDEFACDGVQSAVSKRIYDALIDSDRFDATYRKTEYQRQAVFRSGYELVRIVVHTKMEKGAKKGVWVCKYEGAVWPAEWKHSFKESIGFDAGMGHKIVNWCLQEDGNTETLISWILAKGRLGVGSVSSS